MAIILNEFLGSWNPITNTPALQNGVGNTGNYYIILPQVTALSIPPASVKPFINRDLGSGSVSWIVNFHIYYDGSIWRQMEFQDTPAPSNVPLLQLPVPKVSLGPVQSVFSWNGSLDPMLSGKGASLLITGAPIVTTVDLSKDLIAMFGIYVEMLIYRRSKFSKKVRKNEAYIVPSPYYFNAEAPVPWGNKFWTRSGLNVVSPYGESAFPFPIDRYNHFQVNDVNQDIPVWQYLQGRHCPVDIVYRDNLNSNSTINCIVPITRRRGAGKNLPTVRYAYSPWYTPMYIAFRYVLWAPLLNGGRGQILSGPLSRVVKVSNSQWPFNPNAAATSLYGLPCADISPNFVSTNFKCEFETRLP